MVGLIIGIIILAIGLGGCIAGWIVARNEARYWKAVCAKLINERDVPQQEIEKVGGPQW